jgi:DNA-binding transcriptional ArsR family regulator
MPYRVLAANELGEFLSAIAHPRRIQIIEELRSGERDVGALQKVLAISHSNVSQHLAVLRAHRIVTEQRQGRRVLYQLCTPKLAEWLVMGLQFLPLSSDRDSKVRAALRRATVAWNAPKKQQTKPSQRGNDVHSETET